MKHGIVLLGLCSLACGSDATPTRSSSAGSPALERLGGPAVEPQVTGLGEDHTPAAEVARPSPESSSAGLPGQAAGTPLDVTVPVIAGRSEPETLAPSNMTPDGGSGSAPGADGGVSEEEPAPDASTSGAPSGSEASSSGVSVDADPASEADGSGDTSPPLVTVSFTFDDTYGPQLEASEILDANGLLGTFYVNSPQLHRAAANPDSNGVMSIADVLDMQARGHDIGGHTLGHLSLTDLPEAERVREILGDRAELLRLGIEARSFAYPYGHVEDDDEALGRPVLEIARESGYTSARDTNGFDPADCAPGPESLPPTDPFILRSIRSVNEPPEGEALRSPADDAGALLGWVDRVASCGGGWLPLVFHHLDADCAALGESYCFDFAELDRLAAALASGTRCPADGGACFRVGVATVGAAIGSAELAPAPEVGGLRNASLERALDSGATECIRRTGDDSGVAFSRSDLALSGAASERMEVFSSDTPAELGVERDYGECAIFARPGNAYELSLHYRAEPAGDGPTLRFMSYRLTSDYEWVRWESSDAFEARSAGDWVRLAFDTEAVPEGTIAISFGVRQESAGALNVDDFDSQPLGSVGSGSEE